MNTSEVLKQKQRALREHFPEAFGLRVHRAISWIKRAELCENDSDGKFIFLWIAFNAIYADEREFQQISIGERESFRAFFSKIVELDADNVIYNEVWDRFSGSLRTLMENQFVYNPFWQHHNSIPGYENWSEQLEKSIASFRYAFAQGDTVRVLEFIFDRLYVLRNQLVHGGSTWNSEVNRSQVEDAAAVAMFLVPEFIYIMMNNPNNDWGNPFYPVVSD